MSKNLRPFIVSAALIICAVALWPNSPASAVSPGVVAQLAQVEPGAMSAAYNTSITCAPNISWNPDAGQGLVACSNGYTAVNVESESTTAVYFDWRSGTTRANYATVGRKRCVGCNNGSSYQAEVTAAQSNLFCIASGSTDAGVVVSVECAR